MILKCNCQNSTADALHGKGLRPHTKLATVSLRAEQQECLCTLCYYVRTVARGLKDGAKSF